MIYSFPKPADGYEAVRQAKVWEKAQGIADELRQGGQYKAWIALDRPFKMFKDEYDANDKFTGETSYTIDITGDKPRCSCPDYEKHKNYCKHTMAVEIALDRDAEEEGQEKMLALMDAEMQACEDTVFGCDPFARY